MVENVRPVGNGQKPDANLWELCSRNLKTGTKDASELFDAVFICNGSVPTEIIKRDLVFPEKQTVAIDFLNKRDIRVQLQ